MFTMVSYQALILALVPLILSFLPNIETDAFLVSLTSRIGCKHQIQNADHINPLRFPGHFKTFTSLFIGTGFSFDDGEQVLVSVQKPLGILLEQDEGESAPVVVGEVDSSGSAGQAGVREGDILVAVQNASIEGQSLEYAMEFIGQAPRAVNLRFIRR